MSGYKSAASCCTSAQYAVTHRRVLLLLLMMIMMMLMKMSLLLSLLLLLFAVVHVQSCPAVDEAPLADPIAALRQMAEQATADCYEDDKDTLKITIELEGFGGLLTAQVPPNRNTKCIRYCIMRKNQLLDEAQHLNESAMLRFLATAYLNVNSKRASDAGGITEELLKSVISTCKTQTGNEADRCERSHLVSTCIMAQLNESRNK